MGHIERIKVRGRVININMIDVENTWCGVEWRSGIEREGNNDNCNNKNDYKDYIVQYVFKTNVALP
jgi:hypothetical protein